MITFLFCISFTRTEKICNELGEVKGQDHTNNEQTQSVDDII